MRKWKLLMATAALGAASQFAYAGGPEMPMGHSAIFIGVGGAYNAVQYKNTIFVPTLLDAGDLGFTNGFEDNRTVFGESAVGQLGYDYFFGTGGFFGIKGLFNYLNTNTQFTTGNDFSTSVSSTVVAEFQSMVQAMLEGGVMVGKNAFYLEAGYAALFTKLDMRDNVAGGQVEASQHQTFNGGVAGIGYRRYFWDCFYVDAAYSYALFSDGNTLAGNSIAPGLIDLEDPAPGVPVSSQLSRMRVQNIVLTANYAFNF